MEAGNVLQNDIQTVLIQSNNISKKQDSTFLSDFWLFTKSSLQTAISFEMEQLSGLISLLFIGNYSKDSISGAFGFALALSNIFGNCLSYGISAGLESISAHAYGALDYQLMGIYYNKAIIIQFICSTLCSIIFFFSKDILLLLGFENELSVLSGQYLQLIIPGFFATTLYESLRAQLHAMNIFNIQMYITIISLILHIGWSYLFIGYFEWDLKGAALAKNIVDIQNLILLYLVATKKGYINLYKQPFSREQLKDWSPFLKVLSGIGLIVVFDWIANELYTIQAGKLKTPNELTAQSIISTIYICIQQVAFAVQTTANAIVGKFIGENNKQKAKQMTYIAIILGFLEGILALIFFYIFFPYVSRIFLSDESITPILKELLPILSVVIFFDNYQMGMGGILRSINKQVLGAVSTFIILFVVAAPLTYYFAYPLGLGIRGIWLGMLVATFCLTICYTLIITLTSWNKSIKQVSDRINQDKFTNKKENAQIVNILQNT